MFVDFKPNKDTPPHLHLEAGIPSCTPAALPGDALAAAPGSGAQRIAQWNKRRRRGTQVISWA